MGVYLTCQSTGFPLYLVHEGFDGAGILLGLPSAQLEHVSLRYCLLDSRRGLNFACLINVCIARTGMWFNLRCQFINGMSLLSGCDWFDDVLSLFMISPKVRFGWVWTSFVELLADVGFPPAIADPGVYVGCVFCVVVLFAFMSLRSVTVTASCCLGGMNATKLSFLRLAIFSLWSLWRRMDRGEGMGGGSGRLLWRIVGC